MAQVIVRNLENEVKLILKQRASQHGWSMEEEIRQILRLAVNEERASGGEAWFAHRRTLCRRWIGRTIARTVRPIRYAHRLRCMIILDTNVLSALMQQPDPVIVGWLDEQPAEAVWISSITSFEARYGLGLMVEGQRKTQLQQRFDQLVQIDLANRIVVFDVRAADMAAQLAAERKLRGRTVDVRDTLIAGIAIAQDATLATRNTRHFDDLPTPVINPWQRGMPQRSTTVVPPATAF